MEHTEVINFDDARQKSQRLAKWAAMRGTWTFAWKPYRPRRSLRANAFYWAVVVESFRAFLFDQGEPLTAEQVHELCKAKFLRQTVVNHATGEVIGETTKSTAGMDTAEFSAYVDSVAAWLADTFGIILPAPNTLNTRER